MTPNQSEQDRMDEHNRHSIQLTEAEHRAEKLVTELAEMRAQLAQAVEAKQSAVMMSEERLARAIRAEDALAEVKREPTPSFLEAMRKDLQRALERSTQAKDDLKLMGMQLDRIYDHAKLKDSDRCPDGVMGVMTVNRNAIRLQKERVDEAEAERDKAESDLKLMGMQLDRIYDHMGVKRSARCPNGVLDAVNDHRNAIQLQKERADEAERLLSRIVQIECGAGCGWRLTGNEPHGERLQRIREHAATCPKHPMRALEVKLTAAEAARDAMERYREDAQSAEAKLREANARADLAIENLRLSREECGQLRLDLAKATERANHYLTKAEKNFELRSEAEARIKDLEVAKRIMEAYRDERREALRVLNADFHSIGDLRGDPSWLTPAAALKLRRLAEGNADGARRVGWLDPGRVSSILVRLAEARDDLLLIGFAPESAPIRSLNDVRARLETP